MVDATLPSEPQVEDPQSKTFLCLSGRSVNAGRNVIVHEQLASDAYVQELAETFERALRHKLKKGVDYEDAEFPLRTLRLGQELGIEPWKGCLLRLCDKLSLTLTFVREGDFAIHDEDFSETLLDIICYAASALVLFEGQEKYRGIEFDRIRDRIVKAVVDEGADD